MMYVGELAALGTTLCWAVSALTFEAAGRRIGSVAVNFIRLAMAMGMLAIWGLLLSERHLAWPTDASGHQWYWLGLSGVVGFFLGDLCLFRSFIMIGPRLSTLVFTLAPPMTAVLGWAVLGETLTWLDWTGMAVTLCGVAWVVAEGKVSARVSVWKASAWGVALAFLGALGQAGGNVLSKKGMMGYDPFASAQIRVIASLPAFALLFLVMRWYPRVVRGVKDARAMSLMALGALFGPVVGVSLLLLSMQLLPAAVSQTFVAALPVVILPFTIVLYKERVSPRAAGGAVVAVAGVTLLFITPKQVEWLLAMLG